MFVFWSVVILGNFIITTESQGVIFPKNAPSKDGDTCVLKPTGESGICTNMYDCEDSVLLMKKGYDFVEVSCGPSSLPLICCPLKKPHKSLLSLLGNGARSVPYYKIPENQPKYCGTLKNKVYFEPSANGFSPGLFSTIFGGGGTNAKFSVTVYNVLLGVKEEGENEWFCGGALINYDWVLTAAHCFTKNLTRVRLGEYNIGSDGDTWHDQPKDFEIKRVVIFPDYKYPESYHDLALVQLSQNVSDTSEHIRPVCLPWVPDSNNIRVGKQVTMTGWGAQIYSGNMTNTLQEIILDVYDVQVCKEKYAGLTNYKTKFPKGIDDFHHLCVGDTTGERFSCQGDSGGPIVYQDSKGRYKLYGLVSSGFGCGVPGFPGIYMPIANPRYLDWISRVAF